MKLTRNQIEAWLRQAECTDWGADMSTDDQVAVLRVALRAFDAEQEIARVTAERDARPEISREDARRYVEWRDGFSPHPANVDRLEPVDDALRAHAAGSGVAGSVCWNCAGLGEVEGVTENSARMRRMYPCRVCGGSNARNGTGRIAVGKPGSDKGGS